MLVLRYSDAENQYSWFIRSLTKDGRFFGDLTDKKNFQQRNFRGMISCLAFSIIENKLEVLASNFIQNEACSSQEPFRFSCGHSLNDLKLRVQAETFDLLPKALKEILEILEPSVCKGVDCWVGDSWRVPLRFQ